MSLRRNCHCGTSLAGRKYQQSTHAPRRDQGHQHQAALDGLAEPYIVRDEPAEGPLPRFTFRHTHN